jgi:hypothetical protein
MENTSTPSQEIQKYLKQFTDKEGNAPDYFKIAVLVQKCCEDYNNTTKKNTIKMNAKPKRN